jgi:preprotein translocase subunit SecF
MRNLPRQEEKIDFFQHRNLVLLIFSPVVQAQHSIELIKDLVARIDMKVGTAVGTPGDEGDKVRILPDRFSLSLVSSVLVNPFS